MAVHWRLGLAGALLMLGVTASAEEPATQPEAMRVMQEFWDLVEANRHGETEKLFAEDIVFIDPIWGRYEGREAAARFLKSWEGPAGDGCCTLDRLVADERVGWGFWSLRSGPGVDGQEPWVGVYEVKDGKIVFYRDIHERVYSAEEKAARAEQRVALTGSAQASEPQ